VPRYLHKILISNLFVFLSLILYAEEKQFNFTADKVEYLDNEDKFLLHGNVHIVEEKMNLTGDEVTIDRSTKKIYATGNVVFEEPEKKIYARSLEYDYLKKIGNFQQGKMFFSPWYMNAKQLEKVGEKKLISSGSSLTTCDLESPHYHFRTSKLSIFLEDKLYAHHVFFYAGEIPIFYLPFYYRSLKERRMSIEIYPGYGEKEGFYLRTKIGYPVSRNTYTKVYLDYLERKGWGTGLEYNYQLPDRLRGSLFGYRIKEKDTLLERWILRYFHWSRIYQDLTVTTNLNYLSDEYFSNAYFREDWQKRNLDSYTVNFTYSRPNYTLRTIAEKRGTYFWDKNLKTISSRKEISLPRVTFFTQLIKPKFSPVFYNFTFDLINYYTSTEDFYRLKSDSEINFTNKFALSRFFTLLPSIGLKESWQNRISKMDTKDISSSFYTTNLNLRFNPKIWLSFDFGHKYTQEIGKSVQTNFFAFSGQLQPYLIMDLRFSSGYDILTKKLANLANWFTYRPLPYLQAYIYNIYSLENRQLLSWQTELTYGELQKNYLLSSITYSYPKRYFLRSGFAFSPWKPWRLEFIIRQDLSPEVKHYAEKEINITRDLHCWVLNLYYRERAYVKEFWFTLDLKIAAQSRKILYSKPQEAEWYPWR